MTTPCADRSSRWSRRSARSSCRSRSRPRRSDTAALSARLPAPSGSNTITHTSAMGSPAVGSSRVSRSHIACGWSGCVGAEVTTLVIGGLRGHHGISIQYLSGDRSADRGLRARGDRRGGGGRARRCCGCCCKRSSANRRAAPPGRHQEHAVLRRPRGGQDGLADRQHPAQGRVRRGRTVLDRGPRRLGRGGAARPGAARTERQGGDPVLRHRGVDGAQRAHRRPGVGQADRQARQAGAPARQATTRVTW